MAVESVTLETDRLVLRPLVREHFDELKVILSEPEVVKTLLGDASTPEGVQKSAEMWISEPSFWKANGFGFWGVFDSKGEFGAAGAMLGVAGADEPPPIVGEGPEIYYFFTPNVWGKGIGSEAVMGMCNYLFTELNLPALEALIFAELNPGSVRVANKVGMKLVGRLPLVGHHLSEQRARETMEFDIWRVRNASPDKAKSVLAEATFRIGQLLGEGAWSKHDVMVSLLSAAEESCVIGELGEQAGKNLIEGRIAQGMAAKGISQYRVRRHEYACPHRSSGE